MMKCKPENMLTKKSARAQFQILLGIQNAFFIRSRDENPTCAIQCPSANSSVLSPRLQSN